MAKDPVRIKEGTCPDEGRIQHRDLPIFNDSMSIRHHDELNNIQNKKASQFPERLFQ